MKAFASLATVMPDGRPQVTPVWVDYDGTHVLVNTERRALKEVVHHVIHQFRLARGHPSHP